MQVKPDQLIFTDHAIERYFGRVLEVNLTQDRIIKEISHKGIKNTGYLRGVKIVASNKKPDWVKGRRSTSHYLVTNNDKTVCPVVYKEKENKWVALTTLHKDSM